MQREMDEWLEQKIDEDLDAWAEERMKMLMESEELQDIICLRTVWKTASEDKRTEEKTAGQKTDPYAGGSGSGHDSSAWRGPGGQREEGV